MGNYKVFHYIYNILRVQYLNNKIETNKLNHKLNEN